MKLNWNDLAPFIQSLPKEIQDRIYYLAQQAEKTGDSRYTDLIVEILEQFADNPKVNDLVKRMR